LLTEIELGGTCDDGSIKLCKDSNGQCTGTTCQCKSTHYDNNGVGTSGGSCVTSKY